MTDIVTAIYELMGKGPSESPGPDGGSRHGSEKKSTEANVPSADDKIREKVDSIFSVSMLLSLIKTSFNRIPSQSTSESQTRYRFDRHTHDTFRKVCEKFVTFYLNDGNLFGFEECGNDCLRKER